MARPWIRLALASVLLFLVGCSTVYDASGKTPLRGNGPHVYGGIRTIFKGGGFAGDYSRGIAGIHTSGLDHGAAALLLAPLVFDLCASFIADTFFLPYTLAKKQPD